MRLSRRVVLLLSVAVLSAASCYSGYSRNPGYHSWLSPYAAQSGMTLWLSGNDGTNATATVGSNALVVGRSVLLLNGTTSYVTVDSSSDKGNFGTNDFILAGYADLSDTAAERCLVSKWNITGNQRGWMVELTSSGNFSINTTTNGASTGQVNAAVLKANVPQRYSYWRVVRTGTSVAVTFDGVPAAVTGGVASNIFASTASLCLGVRGDLIGFYSGNMANVSISSPLLSAQWPLEEDSGATVYDVTGNGNLGTATLCTWTNATTYSYLADHGFRASGATNIPALLSGTSAVDGNPITNPSGYAHNGGEYSLVINGVTNSFSDLQGWTGTTNDIRNIYVFTNAPSALFTNLIINTPPWNGVYSTP